jgi:hypothetical protein
MSLSIKSMVDDVKKMQAEFAAMNFDRHIITNKEEEEEKKTTEQIINKPKP